MFRLRRPGDEWMSHFLARQRTAPLTYTEVGASFDDPLPSGYHHVQRWAELGRGEEVWARARAGIGEWCAHAAAGLDVVPRAAPITVGTTVAVVGRVGPLCMVASARIVTVVDEPDRYGFAYGTLPAHPEEGEERFVVTRDASGSVRFDIVAFSRPHDLFTRLGGPVPRWFQHRATERYLDGMRRAVRGPT
jgi:uncharacterized protein (UPF0548 family)